MLVVRFYRYDDINNKYNIDVAICDSIQMCSDGNVRFIVINIEDNNKKDFIIKANQLIDVKVRC